MRMALQWDHLGDLANAAQLTGVDAVRLIALIVKAASNARLHKKNCRLFAQHLKLIGNLLEQLKISELKKYPETREPLEQLEDSLRRSYVLVNGCKDRSYLYLLAMGWSIVYQFKQAQAEIDRYLKLIPLITLVDNYRVKERLQAIEKDQREYTLDEEEEDAHDAILKPECSSQDTALLQKSLSRRYPSLAFEEALREENEKLKVELRRSRANMDIDQCDVIQHLIEVTETVVNIPPDQNHFQHSSCEEAQHPCSDCCDDQPSPMHGSYLRQKDGTYEPRHDSSISSGRDLISERGSNRYEEWRTDLFGCCMEPSLCMKTCIYPCGTFSNIAVVASNGKISPERACNDLMTYSLVFGCCCYTCCMRRKLRKLLNIAGGLCDDFLTHAMCCCCALVQEWREIENRGLDALGQQRSPHLTTGWYHRFANEENESTTFTTNGILKWPTLLI